MFSQSKLELKTRDRRLGVWGTKNRDQLELLDIGLYYLNDTRKKTSLQCHVNTVLSGAPGVSDVAFIVPCRHAHEALSAVRMVMDIHTEDHPDYLLAQQMFLSMPVGFVALTTVSH